MMTASYSGRLLPTHSQFNATASTAGWSCVPDNSAGSTCTLTLGSLAAGASGSADFAVDVDDPVPAGVTEILNNAVISDDGNNGVDPTPGDNADSDNTPVGAFPDLVIVKDDGGVTVEPGDVVTYDLNYSNVGDQDATGVEVTETVPANTTFVAMASTAGWVCVPDSSAGSSCTFTIGNLDVGDSGVLEFAVMLDAPLASGITEVLNSTSISDDGTNGPDINPTDNDASDNTPVRLNPPVGLKVGDISSVGVITWSMWWFNNDNQSDLPTLILDNIPNGTEYLPNTLTCMADGTSQCLGAVFNSTLNRIEVDTVISPDFGAAPDSLPDTLVNEVFITFQTRVFNSGIFENQAIANWDSGNDGSPVDDQNGGQVPVMTDDPVTITVVGDPTAIGVALEIPVFNRWGLYLLILMMLGVAYRHQSIVPYLNKR